MAIYSFLLTYDIHNADLPNNEQLDHMRFKRWIGYNLLYLGFHLNDIFCLNETSLSFQMNFEIQKEADIMEENIRNILSDQQVNFGNDEAGNPITNFTIELFKEEGEINANGANNMTTNYRGEINPFAMAINIPDNTDREFIGANGFNRVYTIQRLNNNN